MQDDADTSTTLIDEITGVQRNIELIARGIDSLPLEDGRFEPCLNGIVTEIERLFVLERELRPLVGEHVAHGWTVVDRGREERSRIGEILSGLDGMGPADDGFHARLDALVQAVRCHIVEQQEHLFPRVRASVPTERLREVHA